ncbi:DUF3558 domain-containing protein [Nocardia takedensis]
MRTIDRMTWRRVLPAIVAGLVVVGVVAGCGTTVEGAPQTAGPSTGVNGERPLTWNPCSDLGSDALLAARVDPAAKETVTDAKSGPVGARMCQWPSTIGPYSLIVGALTVTLDQWRTNTKIAGIQDVRVGGQSALTFYDKSDPDKLACYVALSSPEGSYEISAGWFYSQRASLPQAPPCDLAMEYAAGLLPYLPK